MRQERSKWGLGSTRTKDAELMHEIKHMEKIQRNDSSKNKILNLLFQSIKNGTGKEICQIELFFKFMPRR